MSITPVSECRFSFSRSFSHFFTRLFSRPFSESPRFLTLLAGIHALFYTLALPLAEWKWLIFPALAAITLPVLPRRRLPGRHPYWKLWFFGTCFWLSTAHFIRYPHPINNVLLLALTAYLGAYLPLFTAVSRNLMHHRLPRLFYPLFGYRVFGPVFRTLAFLASVTTVWAACDVLRGWIFSGFMLASAADVFYRTPIMIQTADIAGQWGTSAFLVFLSASLAVLFFPAFSRCAEVRNPQQNHEKNHEKNHKHNSEQSPVLKPVPRSFSSSRPRTVRRSTVSRRTALLAFLFGAAFLLAYGQYRLTEKNPNTPVGNIALLQGCIPSELTTTQELVEKTENTYLRLAHKVQTESESGNHTDLVVFPECIYRYPVIFAEKNAYQPPNLLEEDGNPMAPDVYRERLALAAESSQKNLKYYTQEHIGTSFLAGCSVYEYTPSEVRCYNSALLVPRGTLEVRIQNAYHKMILVPFGEYIPIVRELQKYVPGLETFFPIGSQNSGEHPAEAAIPLADGSTLHASLSICFESVLGRLTRRQISYLRRRGTEPDCIINLTNNGWFGHSRENRLHLACGVFRAVENRKPVLVAANYGISASIESSGRIASFVPTGEEGVLYAHVLKDPRHTFFTKYGGVLLWFPLAILLWGMTGRRAVHRSFPVKKGKSL